MEQTNEYPRAVTRQVEGTGFMRHTKNGALVLCLFVLYCVLLSHGLKASTASAFFGALAAVPLTVHLYHRVWPPAISDDDRTGAPHPSAPARWKASTNRAGLTGTAGREE